MLGTEFAIDKQFFLDLGGYDPGMEIWGGEEMELSFKVSTVSVNSSVKLYSSWLMSRWTFRQWHSIPRTAATIWWLATVYTWRMTFLSVLSQLTFVLAVHVSSTHCHWSEARCTCVISSNQYQYPIASCSMSSREQFVELKLLAFKNGLDTRD